MRRIDTANSMFTNGDPSQAIPATVVQDWFLNHVQEEIAKAIEGFGVALDPASDHQLKDAILAALATKLATSEVVTVAAANKILKLDANSKLPASITGDAATVGGYAASAFLKDVYDSGAFSVATANTYTKAHGLGAAPRSVIVLGRKDNTASGWDVIKYDDGSSDYRWGASCGFDATNVVIKTPSGGTAQRICGQNPTSVSGFAGTETTGEYRVIAIK